MHRLSNGTQTNALPTPPAVVGTPGYPWIGNPALGQSPSEIDAWLDLVMQEELCSILDYFSVAEDKTKTNQIITALVANFAQLNQFGANLAQTGYQKLPSVLIWQWGQANVPANSTQAITYFPAFPTAVLGGLVSIGNGATGSPAASSLNVTGTGATNTGGFIVNNNSISLNHVWMVWGH